MHTKKEEAVHSLHEIEQSISDTIERISVLRKQFNTLKMTMYMNDEDISDEDDDSELPRYTKSKGFNEDIGTPTGYCRDCVMYEETNEGYKLV